MPRSRDFDTSGLKPREKRLAESVLTDVLGVIDDPGPDEFSLVESGGGCPLFATRKRSAEILGSQHGTEHRLTLIFDGGDVYDMLSIDGDGAHFNCSLRQKLYDWCEARNLYFEDHSCWALVIYRK